MRRDAKTLSQVIAQLPGPDVDDIGIKELVLRLIVETPDDVPDGNNASRAKVKLDALRLLADINKNNSSKETHQDLLSILEVTNERRKRRTHQPSSRRS